MYMYEHMRARGIELVSRQGGKKNYQNYYDES